ANPEALQIIPTTGFASMGGVGGPFTVTAQNFSLTNVGTNSLTWTLSNTSLWLNASASGGTLARGGPATNVTIRLNSAASNLLVGTYRVTLWFTNVNDQVGQGRQFTLAVLNPPAITEQPTNQAVLEGVTATFTVGVTGGQPLYYQWQYNSNNLTDGGNISGSTTTNLVISNASLVDAGYYNLTVSNAAAIAISSNALLTIVPSSPVITRQPAAQTVVVGGMAQFAVAAIGTKPFSYQWSLNETNIAVGTNATLVLTNVQFSQAGAYAVVITNIYGLTLSSNANLTVTPCDPSPPGLVSWWAGEDNANDRIGTNNGTLFGNTTYGPGEVGQGFVFDGNGSGVSVGNPSSLQLQVLTIEMWIKRGSSSVIGNGTGAVLFGYDTGGYLLWMDANGALHFNQEGEFSATTGPTIADTNLHHVAVTFSGSTVDFYLDGNLTDSVSHSVTFTFTTPVGIGCYADAKNQGFLGSLDEVSVYNRVLTATEIQDIYLAGAGGKCFTPVGPTITSQPTNQTVVVGQTATFSVSAGGTPPLSYQWTFDTTNIAGATNASLVLNDVQFTNAGNYAVIVSNAVSAVLSSNAVLTVLIPSTIVTQPTNQTVYVGGTASFGVTASGTPPLNYQWHFNQTNIANATNAMLLLTNVQPNQAGTYAVLVANPVNSILSSNAVLTVNLPPSLGVTTSSSFVLIYWPVSAPGFVLETSPSLSPANWVPVPNPPIQIGSEYLESIQMNGTNQFFRLQLSE
ncbi:MAG TPA: immunoglobulin domain-containing protein, partial [Verrucomicrobiae bacterium]|nr:immunoglobulin domain-containing protein [Verrucomicrobiae bacterium]